MGEGKPGVGKPLAKAIESDHDKLYGMVKAITSPMTHAEKQAFHKGREIGLMQAGLYLGVAHTVAVVSP